MLQIHIPSGEIRPIALPDEILGSSTGITGLTSCPEGYVAVLQPGTVVFMNPDFSIHKIHTVNHIRDAHSLAYHRGATYVVSSGTDQVVRVAQDGTTDIFWEASEAGQDTVHLNSVAWYGNDCIVSAFGPKKGNLWSSADEGYVLNIITGEYLMRPVYHPHSVTVLNGQVWVCESSRLSVRSTNGACVGTNWGYLRGICESNGFLYVGSTVGRRKSKSTGAVIDNQADPGLRSGRCGIGIIELNGGNPRPQAFLDLSRYADEIYDVVAQHPASPNISSTVAGVCFSSSLRN